MKKEIHPGVLIGVIAVLGAIIAFVFYKSSQPAPPAAMGAMGPGAALLKKNGGDMTKFMSPEEKAMMQRSMGNHGGAATPGQ